MPRNPENPGRNHMSRRAVMIAGSMIENSILKTGEISRYTNGMSDQKIAEEVSKTFPGTSAVQISRLRSELGYKLIGAPGTAKNKRQPVNSEDVDLLKAQVDMLIDILVEYGFPGAAKARITPKS